MHRTRWEGQGRSAGAEGLFVILFSTVLVETLHGNESTDCPWHLSSLSLYLKASLLTMKLGGLGHAT